MTTMMMMMNCHYYSHYNDDFFYCSKSKKKHKCCRGDAKKKKKKTNNTHESHHCFDKNNKDEVDDQQMMLLEHLLAIQQLEMTHYQPLLSQKEDHDTDESFMLCSTERYGSIIHADPNDEEQQRCTTMDISDESSSLPVLYNAMSCGVYSLMGNCHSVTTTNDGENDEWRASAEAIDEEEDERLVHPDEQMSRREQPWYGYDRSSISTTSSTIATSTTPYVRQGPACARGFLSTLEKYWHMAVRKGLCYTNTTTTTATTSRTVPKERNPPATTTTADPTMAHYDDAPVSTHHHLEDVNVSLSSSSSSMRSLSYSQSGHCHNVTMMNSDDDQVEVWLWKDDSPRNPVVDGDRVDGCGCEDETMVNDDMPPPVRLSLEDITTPDISIWRPRIAEWIYKVLDHFEVDREVAYVALWYLDRFVAHGCLEHANPQRRNGAPPLEPFSLEWYQCASMACVALASKLWAIRDPHDVLTITDLLKLSRQGSLAFSLKDVCQMELNVLHTLEWHVHPPTSCNVVSLLVKLGNPLVVVTEDVLQLAYFLTELATLQQEFMATYDAITTAWAALAVSFEEHNGVGANPLMNHLTARHGIVVGMHHICAATDQLRRLYHDHLSAAASASNSNDVDPSPKPNSTPTPRTDSSPPKRRPVMVVSPKGVASGSSCTTEDNATTHYRNVHQTSTPQPNPSRVVWGRPRSLGTGTFV